MIDKPDLDDWHRNNPDAEANVQASDTLPADAQRDIDTILDRYRQGKATPDTRHLRISKTVRIPPLYSEMLRVLAYTETRAQGRKISESDLVVEALEDYFRKRGVLPSTGAQRAH
ncbi:hypothetical protein [Modicisalibacter xianhensis]|uniref:Uncharacterized protein n=1 Tax=Modicisalibacter xianhensis TaxID=442341 RepID=A0A1I3GC50_9GAMM|nr:hypothetical protein [Halomonas xianhensis]SFI20997.1 hypothetical protein SAMN04487959_12926 [Halomonas xianhensis]